MNLGHLQKYPEFYKTCENTFGNTGFKRAARHVLARRSGRRPNDTIDVRRPGDGRVGGTRPGSWSRPRFSAPRPSSTTALAEQTPGRPEGNAQRGRSTTSIHDIPELGYGGMRVFAPTNRIVVFCPRRHAGGQVRRHARREQGQHGSDAVHARRASSASRSSAGRCGSSCSTGAAWPSPHGPTHATASAAGQRE